MADTTPFGKLSILETVNLGLMDFARSLQPLLMIAVIPTLITAIYQTAIASATPDGVPIWTRILLMLPEYLIAAPFYMALLYQLSRIRHSPPTQPRDAVFAGLALFRPFIVTTLFLVAGLVVAGMVLGLMVQTSDAGQLVIGLPGLLAILIIYVALLALSFYPHIILFEQQSGRTALGMSLGLFRAHWKRILAVLVFPVMLVLMMQSMWMQFMGVSDPSGEPPPQPGFLTALLTQLFSWVILGVFEGVRLVLFQDLRARRGP